MWVCCQHTAWEETFPTKASLDGNFQQLMWRKHKQLVNQAT